MHRYRYYLSALNCANTLNRYQSTSHTPAPTGVAKIHKPSFFDKVDRNWEKAWVEGVTPWELKSVNPTLKEALDKKYIPITKNSDILIPGCGSGYDAIYIKQFTNCSSVTGIDISASAVTVANNNLKNLHSSSSSEGITFKVVDFFAVDKESLCIDTSTSRAGKKYDIIIDYLFFSAINADMRRLWVHKMYELLADGGTLVTFIFPLKVNDDDKSIPGPPYHLNLDDYKHYLEGSSSTNSIYSNSSSIGSSGAVNTNDRKFLLNSSYSLNNSIKPRLNREYFASWKKQS